MAKVADDVVAQARTLLSFLEKNSDKNWTQVMTKTLTEGEREATHAGLAKLLAPLGRDVPYGAFAGGTGALKEAAGLDGEHAQEAIKFLKSANRLLQVGKGRGKCLIAVNVDELGDEEIRATLQLLQPDRAPRKSTAPVEKVPDPPVQDDEAVTAMFRAIERVLEEKRELKRENVELKTILAEFDKLKQAATWA